MSDNSRESAKPVYGLRAFGSFPDMFVYPSYRTNPGIRTTLNIHS